MVEKKTVELLKEMPSNKNEVTEFKIFPGFEIKKANQIEAKTQELEKFVKNLWDIDKNSIAQAKNYKNKITDHIKDIEDTRTALKAPVLEAWNSIDAAAKKYKAPLLDLKKILTDGIWAFNEAEEKRKNDEIIRVQDICNNLKKCDSKYSVWEYFKDLPIEDRRRKAISEAYKERIDYLIEQENLKKMQEEQAELEEKKRKQEERDIDKLFLMWSIEELWHFQDYIENIYDQIPERIQKAITLKEKILKEEQEKKRLEETTQTEKSEENEVSKKSFSEDITQESCPSQTVSETPHIAPVLNETVSHNGIIPKVEKNAVIEKKELNPIEKFNFLLEKLWYWEMNHWVETETLRLYVQDIEQILIKN